MAAGSAAASVSATMRMRAPGSSVAGSSAVDSSVTDCAPASSRASDNASACAGSSSSVIESQATALFLLLRLLGELLLEVVDRGAAAHEPQVVQQLQMQRDVGLDAFDRHFRERDRKSVV